MASRRAFLSGLIATGVCPRPTWADAGSPDFISAAKFPDGTYWLVGMSEEGNKVFELPLPGRGHAAAAHPVRPEAVAFARRPGTFATVIDCANAKQIASLEAPTGRHFYGHGAFSADGTTLFTSENDFEAGQGVIGVWDVRNGYRRQEEFPTGGVGPHDVRLMPDGQTLVVANGGIETHPEMGRAKLNLPMMQPSLTYIDVSGSIHEQVELSPELHKNSIRHLAVWSDGTVAFAMQWQGEAGEYPPLLGLHVLGQAPVLLQADRVTHQSLRGYVGSVAISANGQRVAITSPRGGVIQEFDTARREFLGGHAIEDVCGICTGRGGFIATAGTGEVALVAKLGLSSKFRHDCQWDNHLVRIT